MSDLNAKKESYQDFWSSLEYVVKNQPQNLSDLGNPNLNNKPKIEQPICHTNEEILKCLHVFDYSYF